MGARVAGLGPHDDVSHRDRETPGGLDCQIQKSPHALDLCLDVLDVLVGTPPGFGKADVVELLFQRRDVLVAENVSHSCHQSTAGHDGIDLDGEYQNSATIGVVGHEVSVRDALPAGAPFESEYSFHDESSSCPSYSWPRM